MSPTLSGPADPLPVADGAFAIGSLSIAARHEVAIGSEATYLLRSQAIGADRARGPCAGLACVAARMRKIVFDGSIVRICALIALAMQWLNRSCDAVA
jgi:hypothetical protein